MNRYVVGEVVITPDGKGMIYEYRDYWYTVKLENGGGFKYYTEKDLRK
ncbi:MULTISPECIES: hypothetical protein [Paenibacillus]|nr:MULTISPECIES: hypothetical protein [Paenibacillus]MDY8045287.1 hypothetical protein [Paenibacillus polymyxa]